MVFTVNSAGLNADVPTLRGEDAPPPRLQADAVVRGATGSTVLVGVGLPRPSSSWPVLPVCPVLRASRVASASP